MRKRIFLVAGGYPPGYKSGGPVRSIVNMVDWLGDEYDFYIMALDRDTGERQPFPGIKVGKWQQVGKAQVIYLPMRQLSLMQWREILISQPYDLIFQNSYFDPGSLKTVLLWRTHMIPHKPLILSPRGEFAQGARSVKKQKKQMFIRASQLTRLHRHPQLHWHVTNQFESETIKELLGASPANIHYAPNMPPKTNADTQNGGLKKDSITKLAFVARIVPVKNLDYALDILTTVTQPVQFDIYGPVEDSAYWQQCEAKMANLPAHIQAHYCGVLAGDQVIDSLAEYHGLLLPTRSENFGHSILEALTAGCLPIISDQTPWRNLADEQVGWDLPLDQPEKFKQAIERLIAMDDATWQQWSANARDKAHRFATESGVIEQTRQMFEVIVNSGRKSDGFYP